MLNSEFPSFYKNCNLLIAKLDRAVDAILIYVPRFIVDFGRLYRSADALGKGNYVPYVDTALIDTNLKMKTVLREILIIRKLVCKNEAGCTRTRKRTGRLDLGANRILFS